MPRSGVWIDGRGPQRSLERGRRDMNQLVSLMSAHALLHQGHRELDAKGRIMATLDDYTAVAPIMHAATDALAGQVLPHDVAAIVRAVRARLEELARIALHACGVSAPTAEQLERGIKDETWTVTIGELSTAIGRPPETARRWLGKAKAHGAVMDHEAGKGRPARLSLDQALVAGGGHVFPDTVAVAEWCEDHGRGPVHAR